MKNYISLIERYKIVPWLLLLLSVFSLYQTIRSWQKEQLQTQERQKLQQRVDNNLKKANSLKEKADQLILEAKKVSAESQSCLAKKDPLPNECEGILSKSVAITHELNLIIDNYKKLTDEVKKDSCFLYPDLDDEFCKKVIDKS